MEEKIKNFLHGLGGVVLFALTIVTFLLLIIGGVKLFEWLYPFLEKINVFVWSVVWLLVFLSIIPGFRLITGSGIVIGTYIGAAIFWFLSFYITYSLWGIVGLFVGVGFLGLGVYFTAILALLFKGLFKQAVFFIFNLISIFLLRTFGLWIATKYKSKRKPIPEVESLSKES